MTPTQASNHRWLAAAAVLALLGLGACKAKPEAPPPVPAPPPPAASAARVTEIQLGKAIDESKRISQPAQEFAPADIIYVAVTTDGRSPAATLVARWTYEGTTPVDETSQTIAVDGPATTEFHVAKPDGWPAGAYAVEILLDGVSTGTRSFSVR